MPSRVSLLVLIPSGQKAYSDACTYCRVSERPTPLPPAVAHRMRDRSPGSLARSAGSLEGLAKTMPITLDAARMGRSLGGRRSKNRRCIWWRLAVASATWATSRAFRFSCVAQAWKIRPEIRVEKPICRALSTMIRTGFPASTCCFTASYSLRCAGFITSGTSEPSLVRIQSSFSMYSLAFRRFKCDHLRFPVGRPNPCPPPPVPVGARIHAPAVFRPCRGAYPCARRLPSP